MASPTANQTSELTAADVMLNPNAVVFAGDGDPHTPRSTIDRLQRLLDEGKLQPDKYSLGGSVEEFENYMAAELGKEAAIWMPTGSMANILGLRRHAGTAARVVLQEGFSRTAVS